MKRFAPPSFWKLFLGSCDYQPWIIVFDFNFAGFCSMPPGGILSTLQELLGVAPEQRGDSLQHYCKLVRQEDPPTPVSARVYDHDDNDIVGLTCNRRPRPVTGEDGVVRKLHDRNGQLRGIAPDSDADHSPKWFLARSVSSAVRSLVSWGCPWVRVEVLRESWGKPFLWDDCAAELLPCAAFCKKIVQVPLADDDTPVAPSTTRSSARSDLALIAYSCGTVLTRDLAYFCETCTTVVKMRGARLEDQLYSLARHFNSAGHRSNQGSLPGRAHRGRLSVFPFFFVDHECFKRLSARQFMDDLNSGGLNPALRRFASTLRDRLRPDGHFVYIHKGMGRFFCLARRSDFAPSAGHRSGPLPFVLEERTCPYDRVISASLQRLRQENFGEPVTSVSTPQPSARSSEPSSIPPPPPLPVQQVVEPSRRSSIWSTSSAGTPQDDSPQRLPSTLSPSPRAERRPSLVSSAPFRAVRGRMAALPRRSVPPRSVAEPTVTQRPRLARPPMEPQPLPARPFRLEVGTSRPSEGYRYGYRDAWMQARPADVPTMPPSARFAARPADFQRRPLPPTSPREVWSTELPRAVSLTPRAEEVVATPTPRPDAEAPAPRQLQQLPDYVGERWAPPNVMLPRDGGRLTVRLPQVLSSGEVRPEMVQAELELSNVGQPHRFHDRVAITAIMAMWVPVDPQSGLAVVPREQQPVLPVLRPAPAALQLEDVLDAISAVGPVDTSVDLHEFDAQSLVNTEAEVDIINESLSYLPRSEDLDGVLPPIRPVDQNAFDWDIDSTIEKAGIRHPGWTRPWPFRPVPFVPWRMVALRCDPTSRRGDMEYLTSAPFVVTREDVLSGDWGEFWQGFDDGHGCNGFLNNAFVAFEHPLVAGVLPSFDEDCSARLLFLSELGEGPQRNKDSREEAWPENPEIVTAAGVLRWLHSAQVGAMAVTIHCSQGSTHGEIRSECDVLFCCNYHLERALPVVMRLSRERPLRPNSYVFSARSTRAFECGLEDDYGRPSGLDRPESLVDMLYKYESVRAREGFPLPRAPLTPFPEVFNVRPNELIAAPATGVNRRREHRSSINFAWSRCTDSFEDVVRPVLERWREQGSQRDEEYRHWWKD